MAHPGVEVIRGLFADRRLDERPLVEQRDAMAALTKGVVAPVGVRAQPSELAGRAAEHLVPDDRHGDGTVLYLHGGGYVAGDLNSHRDLAGTLALLSRRTVVTLDYRLAPEHPFPAALDDAVAAFEQLSHGGRTEVAIAGDSAGGGLAVATALRLRDERGPEPAALAVISPWTDLTQSAPSHTTNAAADPTVTASRLDRMAQAYLAGLDPRHPLASPRFADLRGLPPLRIDVGGVEVLLDDSVELAGAARAAGVDVELHVWPELFHVFVAFPPELIAESAPARQAIAAFLAEHLPA